MICHTPSRDRRPIRWVHGFPAALMLLALLASGCGDGGVKAEAQDRSNDVRPGWTDIALGPTHTLGVAADGTLWSWGSNSLGQLGIGLLGGPDRMDPVQVGTSHKWKRVAAGSQFSLGVREDGTLWTWGNNASGQLGHGGLTVRTSPKQVGSANNWSKVAAGDNFSAALRTDGTLWTWGDNTQGQLGHSPSSPDVPTKVPTPTPGETWVALSAGRYFMLAILSDRKLWSWGDNTDDQLGNGCSTPCSSPTAVEPTSSWRNASAGTRHSMGIRDDDGALLGWGRGTEGQQGWSPVVNHAIPTGTGFADAKAVVAAGDFTQVIRTDGTRWATGQNSNGSLGDTSLTSAVVFFQADADTDWAVLVQGYGAIHAAAYKSDASLWIWGANGAGQLGDGTNGLNPVPVQLE